MTQTWAAVGIFIATYAGVAVGRLPGLRIDRAGIALVGAALMLATGVMSLDEALRAIDLRTLALLLGMMIIVGHLRLSGFFRLAAGAVVARAHHAPTLLAAVVATSALFSAFLVNDAVCLVMTPLVLETTRRLGRNPAPYLLALAMASNAGSVATITGNPQNMIIGVASGIAYADFVRALAPVAVVACALSLAATLALYRAEFARGASFAATISARPARVHRWQAAKALIVAAGVIAAFFAGVPVAEAAIVGGAALLLTRAVKPWKFYAEIDGALLLLFAGLFVVAAGAEKALVTPDVLAQARALGLDDAWRLTGLTAGLSNLVSNVPAVLMLQPFIGQTADPQRAWLVVAMASTLAGNLTLVGSIANLIVAERARREGVVIDFWTHAKIGAPVTLLSLVFGAAWLAR